MGVLPTRPSGVSSTSANLSEPPYAHLQIWAAQDCFTVRGGPSAQPPTPGWQERPENEGLLPLLRTPSPWPRGS